MVANDGLRESAAMTDEPEDLAEVQRQLEEIQRRKRDDLRWGVSRHTAERAIEAIAQAEPRGLERRPAGKGRRRKRHKRLL